MPENVTMALIALIAGFIIGWLVEWLIDLIHWRRIARRGKERISSLEASLKELKGLLQDRDTRIRELRSQIRELKNRDEFSIIKGIGRTYERALYKAGINTFKQLAELDPERIQEIIYAPDWRKLDPESWIEQAKQLATQEEGR